MLSDRQKSILNALVEEYTEHGIPVASDLFSRKHGFSVSPATIRNELAALEQAGYIAKPHTSAGRVPTDAGYRLYVNTVRERSTKPAPKERQLARVIETSKDDAHVFARTLAKALADLSTEVAFVSIDADELSYAGIAHLFEKPEFWSHDHALTMTRVFDELESAIPTLFSECLPEPHALIGRENPLFQECSVVMARYDTGEWEGLLGIVGPLRMHYAENIQLLETTKKLLDTYDRPTTNSKRRGHSASAARRRRRA
ncbi:hypothetical protein HY629_01080 [Candidatus Uhrbacteria bacterium]|nr:hypothetical protein [Candidatus Uhrbacteria bacterium]